MVDISSGDFEVDSDEDAASERIEARQPNGTFYLMRADGGPAYFMGAGVALTALETA